MDAVLREERNGLNCADKCAPGQTQNVFTCSCGEPLRFLGTRIRSVPTPAIENPTNGSQHEG